jgi:hypothetical protein
MSTISWSYRAAGTLLVDPLRFLCLSVRQRRELGQTQRERRYNVSLVLVAATIPLLTNQARNLLEKENSLEILIDPIRNLLTEKERNTRRHGVRNVETIIIKAPLRKL